MISDFIFAEVDILYKNENFEQFEEYRRKTDKEYASVMESFGFARAPIKILFTLFCFERPCTQKEICDDWFENKQTINSAAKKLLEGGYIDIAPSPDNFREKYLVLTEKGKFFAMRTVGKMMIAEKKAFARLSEKEQEDAVSISKKYYELLKEEFGKVKGENK